jgi:ligand-binding SRPBCC domain-containing protein
MHTYILERTQVIEKSRGETFAFFSDAFNLERLTPSFLNFRILNEPPVEMAEGTLLEYRLGLFGIRFYWKTLIEKWSPEESFVDVQLKGPYALWRHTHTFEELSPTSTLVRDRVEYQIPYKLFGRLAHILFVKRTLKRIFDYRAQIITQLLAPAGQSLEYDAEAGPRRHKIA